MGLGKKWFLWSQVVIGMLLVQAFATGMQILSRIILVEGTFVFALMTYRHLDNRCYGIVLLWAEKYNSYLCNKFPQFSSYCHICLINFTQCRLERLNLHTKEGKVKCIGALMCVSGALITSLYKGKSYYIISHHHTSNDSHTIPHTTHTNWPLGTLMLVGSCFSCSAWFLIQVKLKRIFPYRYWAILLTCLIGAVQSAIIVYTGMQLLSRIILVKGTFVFALITYRNVVAAICVAPLAYYFEIRMERLRLGSKEGKVKTIGALLCVSGALLTALYKGNEFFISNHHSDHHSPIIITPHHHWTRGTIMLLASTLAYSSWFIVQVKLQKQLPFVYLSTMLTCILSSFQSVILGLCLNTDSIAWSLGWNLQLVTIIYSGILATAVNLCLLSWAISVQGPTYPPMFNPLALIFVAFLEALTLGEPITVGTLIGVVLIIFGLYSFLWGKRKEMQRVKEEAANSSANHELN
ncbi:hypothetical protein G4B88_023470 [Cannabis sativa]|uniref:EamA domain-containing protein n=1 Tax=Cannabis sativa TaxID=3483 RepID=A0A7J6HUI5_CANSA|nr:hypothetical protein G4B88_023470 [Cannabis sativa]